MSKHSGDFRFPDISPRIMKIKTATLAPLGERVSREAGRVRGLLSPGSPLVTRHLIS